MEIAIPAPRRAAASATCSSAATCRSTPARRCSASSRTTSTAERRRRTEQRTDRPGCVAGCGDGLGRRDRCAPSCSGSTSTRHEPAAQVDSDSISRTPPRWGSSTRSPTCARSRPSARTIDGDEPRRTEHFNTFLRSLDVEREGLPTWFGDRLPRARRPLRRDEPRAVRRAGSGVAAHLHRASNDATSRLPVVMALLDAAATSPLAGPARDARPPDRGDPAAVPGDRQPGAGGPLQPLRPPALRRGARRGVGDDAQTRRRPGALDRLDRRLGPDAPPPTGSSRARSRSGRSSPRTTSSPTPRRRGRCSRCSPAATTRSAPSAR